MSKLRKDKLVIKSEYTAKDRVRKRQKVRWIAETFSREGQPNSEGDFRSALEFITQFKFQLGVRYVPLWPVTTQHNPWGLDVVYIIKER